MSQRIEFKLPNNAKNVAEHLYNVQVEGNCLIFSEFDEEAFELAVALESLDESTYNIIQNRFTARTFAENTLTIQQATQFYNPSTYKITLGLGINLEGLNIPPSFPLTAFDYVLSKRFEQEDELVASLAIDVKFLEFMSVLMFQKEKQGNPLNLQAIPRKAELTVKNFRSRRPKRLLSGLLKVFDDNQIELVEFEFLSITLERTSFENS